MTNTDGQGEAEEALRIEAADWRARMTGPDAEPSRLAFERWRAQDPRNRKAYERLERADVLSAALRASEIGQSRDLSRARSIPTKSQAIRYALAAAAVLLLSIGSAVMIRRPVNRPDALALENGSLVTKIGQIRKQRLSDGSLITVDTDSQVDVQVSRTVRLIRLLRGRARFEVAHDAARPFLVRAAGRIVIAKGTVFDVFIDHGALRVSLLHGKVDVAQVAPGGPNAPRGYVHMHAGQALRATTPRVPATIASLVRGETQWPSGMLSFDNIPLADLLEQTNRYSQAKIRLGEPASKTLRVTGAFRPLPVGELAAALATAFSLRVEQDARGDLVLRRR